ncbi:Hypothetical protein R9X50_00047900 [Acrodontium crateriforme]|uniref:WSC domain-containing protein n=1 Tax=Acrodontium crateriforme TaxID=150365 RepID=A0AAQ3LXJ8_9PEZI|nr:Hypothetical protein R9X50_00047900 [Acrodontium crateriforme]
MSSTKNTSYAAVAVYALSLLAAVGDAHAHRSNGRPVRIQTHVKRQQLQYVGCFSNPGDLTDVNSYAYQTKSYCQPICVKQNKAVMGLSKGSDCWCGDDVPDSSTKVDDSNCNVGCFGFGSDMCGGDGFYSVYKTGISGSSGSSSSSSQSSSSSSSDSDSTTSTTPTTSIATRPGQTVIVTTTNTAEVTATGTAKHSNTAGIAAGVVVGIVAVAAIVGGAIFFLKRRRQQQAAEEHRRATQVSDFMRERRPAPQPPSSGGYSNGSDQRLEPEAGARRNSVGSIADDQDFSRRILRVANPDR